MDLGGVEIVCAQCGSGRVVYLLPPVGLFVCASCGAVMEIEVRERERDWDAEMAELWAAEGHTVA